jgi:hypothetical protein
MTTPTPRRPAPPCADSGALNNDRGEPRKPREQGWHELRSSPARDGRRVLRPSPVIRPEASRSWGRVVSRPGMDNGLIAEVLAAVDVTMRLATARVRHDWDAQTLQFGGLLDWLEGHDEFEVETDAEKAMWSQIRDWVTTVDDALSTTATGRRDGVVDFAAGRCIVTHADGERLYYEPARTLAQRDSGKWKPRTLRPFEGSRAFSPVWLVELARGASGLTVAGIETISGAQCRKIAGSSDPRLAAERSWHGMQQLGSGETDRPVAFEVWINPSGELVKVSASRAATGVIGGVDLSSSVRAEVTLSDLGQGAPIDPPAEEEIDTTRDWRLTVAEAITVAWVERVREILPTGITIEHAGGFTPFRMRADPHGGSLSMFSPVFALALAPGTEDEKLANIYRGFANSVQRFLSEHPRRKPWPGPRPQTHVEVTADAIEVWWSTVGRPSTRQHRPIPPRTVRLRPIPRTEIGI